MKRTAVAALCAVVVICSAGLAHAMDAEFERLLEMPTVAYLRANHCSLSANVEIGMTEGEVWGKWCQPFHMNTTETRSGTHDQWIYPDPDYVKTGRRVYLYFDNGVLEAIQRRR